MSLFGYFVIKNYKRKKIVKRCLKDPDAFITTAKCVDTSETFNSKIFDGSKVKVEFKLAGNIIVKISGEKHFFNGYDKVFNKYIDKTIKILYSPLYDEVLLLKSKYF